MAYKIAEMTGRLYEKGVTRYGIEVELENVHQPEEKQLKYWTDKDDGSLRNFGVEFITPPLPFNAAYQAIQELYSAKEWYRWTGGHRCGVHVHVEINELTVEELQALVTAYLYVEPLLFSYVGNNRDENIYCIPFYRAPGELDMLSSARENYLHLLHDQNKYSGLYLEPILRFGTVEFRMPPVFDNAYQLQDFVLFVRRLREFAENRSPLGIVNQYEAYGGNALVRSIFGSATDRLYHGDAQALMDEYDVESWVDIYAKPPQEYRDEWAVPDRTPADSSLGYWQQTA